MLLDNDINNIDTSSIEGKQLLGAISILTTQLWGNLTPNETLSKINDISNYIFYKDEYEKWVIKQEKLKLRKEKLKKLNGTIKK